MIVYGIAGISQFLKVALRTSFLRSTAWILLFGSVLALWFMRSADYSKRIEFYERVHMQIADWINEHAPPDAVIATHDIGIIGYFTNRQIVDLAGLVTPEMVPLMNDTPKIAQYLRSKHASYLIVYRDNHYALIHQFDTTLVFTPHPELMTQYGLGPFDVYEIDN